MRKKNPYFIIIIVLVVAYFPLVSGLMSVTNDTQVVTYPIFYFFSNQLRLGHFPWWHFNIHLGFPLHADPGTPFWNPVYWLFALAGNSYYIFTLYIWVHVIIAAAGILKFCKWLQLSDNVCIAASIAYVCCGYFASHLQHLNNIIESAFIPFVVLYFLKVLFETNLPNALYLAVSLFFFVNSGYPGFPFGMLYFLIVLFLSFIIFNKQIRSANKLKKFFFFTSISAATAVIFCLPYIVSLAQILDNFNRAKSSVTKDFVAKGGIAITSFLSFLWPHTALIDDEFSTTATGWNNMFIGTMFFSVFMLSLVKWKHPFKWPLLISGLFLLLLSFQGGIKEVLYTRLPFLKLVRSNGEFRIFFLFSAIIVAASGLENLYRKKEYDLLKRPFYILAFTCFPAAVIAAYFAYGKGNLHLTTDPYTYLKSLTIPGAVLFNSVIALVLLSFALLLIYKNKFSIYIIIAEIIIGFWLALPYGSLGLDSVKKVNEAISQNIRLINSVPGNPFLYQSDDSTFAGKFVTEPVFYANNIGLLGENGYQSRLTSYANYINTHQRESLLTKRGIHINGNDTANRISNLSIFGDAISFNVRADTNSSVVVLQNHSGNWHLKMDNKPATIQKYKNTFISIPVTKGGHFIQLRYYPKGAATAFFISLGAWIIVFIILIRKERFAGKSATSGFFSFTKTCFT